MLAGAVSTMVYVSVYAGRFREINRVSIIYGLIFVVTFLLLHLVERLFLPQADPFLLPITALLAAIGLTEMFPSNPLWRSPRASGCWSARGCSSSPWWSSAIT